MTSCYVNYVPSISKRSRTKATTVSAPVLSTTVASLKVADKPITFKYVMSEEDGYDKDVALENAKYQALQQFGGDVLVKVSYQIKGNTITLSGYPATYSDFRTPTAEDRENLKAFGLASSLAVEK